jgi:mannose-6-phosphate isomerase-like protein (cupin superfamily)
MDHQVERNESMKPGGDEVNSADSGRVYRISDAYKSSDEWFEVESKGRTDSSLPIPAVVARTSGRPRFRGFNLWWEGAGFHMVQVGEVAPGDRKYLHRHHDAETVWVILEGEGEFYPDHDTAISVSSGMVCHAYPGEWHGLGNTGDVPLRYLSVEGPFWRTDTMEMAE